MKVQEGEETIRHPLQCKGANNPARRTVIKNAPT